MTSAVREQEPIWKRVYDAINLQDHRNIRDPYGFSTLGQRWQDKTIGKEWREGQMADVWDLLPDEWKPGVAEWGKGMAEKFGTAWMDARTLEGKEWLDPTKIAAAGTARTLEALGIPFELLSQATSQITGLDIDLSRLAVDFIPVGGVASKLSKVARSRKLVRRASLLANTQHELYPLLEKAVKAGNRDEMAFILNKMESLDANFIRELEVRQGIQASLTKPRTTQQIEDAIAFVNDAKYNAPRNIFGEEIVELLETNRFGRPKRLPRTLRKLFGGDENFGFRKELSDYLNLAYLWRKGKYSLDPSQPMKGFPLGNTIFDPKGNAWVLSSEGAKKGYTLKPKSTLDEIAAVRASARKIPIREVELYFIDKLGKQGMDPSSALVYARRYIQFNRQGKKVLKKIIKDTNKRAGKVILTLDHLEPVDQWIGGVGGADIYHNLMLLDKVTNSKLGANKNPQLNLALGAVKNIFADIDIWLDKFGPGGTGQLWGFFRDMTDLQRQQLFERAIRKGENVQDILEKMKFGQGVFQGSLF